MNYNNSSAYLLLSKRLRLSECPSDALSLWSRRSRTKLVKNLAKCERLSKVRTWHSGKRRRLFTRKAEQ